MNLIKLIFGDQTRSDFSPPYWKICEKSKCFTCEEIFNCNKNCFFIIFSERKTHFCVLGEFNNGVSCHDSIGFNSWVLDISYLCLINDFIDVDEDDAMGLALDYFGIIGLNTQLLGVRNEGVKRGRNMLERPVLRVGATFAIEDAIVYENMVVICVEKDSCWFISGPWNKIEMVEFGKRIDFEYTPNWVV